MEDNSLFLDLVITKKKLIDLIYPLVEIYTRNPIDIQSFKINLTLPNAEEIKLTAHGRKVFLSLPLGFKISKPDGIFSIEADGEIKLDINTECHLDEYLTLKTETELLDFEWIKEPSVTVGSLNIEMETIADCIIKTVKDDIVNKIDQTISQKLDVRAELTSQLEKIGHNIIVHKKPDIFFNFELLQVQTQGFVDGNDHVNLHLFIEIAGKISDEAILFEQSHDPRFFWLEKEPVIGNQYVEVQMSYTGLAKAIAQEFNGKDLGGKKFEIDNISIRHTNRLELKAAIFAPIKAIVTLTGIPVFDHTKQTIGLDNIDIDVDAQNIIYKLSSPIIEKIISSRLEDILPVDIRSTLKPYMNNLPSIDIMNQKVHLTPTLQAIRVDKFDWSASHVNINLVLEKAEVDIEV